MSNLFSMKKPCGNCPFLKEGAIDLRPGRMEGIVKELEHDDHALFFCHKTVHHPVNGGEFSDEGKYVPSGNESACCGALVYSLKTGNTPVMLRIALMTGDVEYETLMAQAAQIIDIIPVPQRQEPQQ